MVVAGIALIVLALLVVVFAPRVLTRSAWTIDRPRTALVCWSLAVLLGVVGFVAGIALVVLADRPLTDLLGGNGSPTHGFNVGVALLAVIAFVVAVRVRPGPEHEAVRQAMRSGVAPHREIDGTPVLVDQVATWCAGADVTIKPIIDLNRPVSSSGYAPSDPVAERVRLAWPQCVFPFCTRRARTDLDHIAPYDPDGPPGQTSTTNLAPLCRTHHRMKTHSGWSYRPAETSAHGVPTTFAWVSPRLG